MPDLDIEIALGGGGRGEGCGGGQSSRPLDNEEGGRSPQKIVSALWASVWSKNKGGRVPGPLGASPGSATELYHPRPKKTLLYKLFHPRREYGGFGFFKVVFLIRNTTERVLQVRK